MADQTEKRRELARRAVTHATLLANAERELTKLLQEATDAGLVFVDTDFTGQQGLAHLDASTFNLLGGASGIVKAIDNTLSANSRALWIALSKIIP